ncbi:MAG: hypothetical protein ACEY3B_02745 [Wolbachia sp.]
MPFFSFGKFLNIYSNMNWAGRCHSSAPFFVIPVPRHWDLAFIIWLKLSLLDPSVSYFHDIIIK